MEVTPLPEFKGKPFTNSEGETFYTNFLEDNFGKAALSAYNQRLSDFNKNPIVDVLFFEHNYVNGEGPFPNILMNEVLSPHGIHTATSSELERILEQEVLDLGGSFQYPALVLRSEDDPTNPFVYSNLVEQIKEREELNFPYMISTKDLAPSPNKKAKDGIAIMLKPNAQLLHSPQLSEENDGETFSKTDEYGRPIFDSDGSRTLYTLEWGLSPYCLDKENDYDSEGGSLRGAASSGRMVVVSEKSA